MLADARSAGRLERVLALRTFPGLARLGPTELAAVADIAAERYFRRGVEIARPGAPVRSIQLIRRGRVHVLRAGAPLRSYGAGDAVGGLVAFLRELEGQHLVAAEDTDTFEIDVDDMEDVLEDSFPVLLAVLRELARSVLEARQQLGTDAGFATEVDPGPDCGGDLSAVERIVFVRNLLAYGRARVEAIAELAREMLEDRIEAGHELWAEGDWATHSCLIVGGAVECSTSRGHRFQFGPDSVVGGIDSLAGLPRWFRAVAATDVIALRSDAANLLDVLEDHPDMGLDMLRVLARTLLELRARCDARAAGSSGE